MTHVVRFVSLAVAAVASPPSIGGGLPAMTHLAAIGLLVADRMADNSWRFAIHTNAIGAGDGEDRLLAWAAGALPNSGTVIAWQLAETIVPPLLDAGSGDADGDPEIARAFLDRLLKLLTAPSIDLALPHGGAGAPPFEATVRQHGIAFADIALAEIESAWAFGDRRLLTAHVEDRAIATWRLWLAEANGAAAVASEAFEQWLAS